MLRRAYMIKTARGRLGNRLLPLLSIKAYCLERGLSLTNHTLKQHAEHLAEYAGSPLSRARDAMAWRVQRWVQLSKLVGTVIKAPNGEPFVRLPPTADDVGVDSARGPLFFIGHRFYNPEGIHAHHNELAHHVRPVAPIARAVHDHARMLPNRRLCVALHIRQTDMVAYKGGQHHTPFERYVACAHELNDRFRDLSPAFFVFSDTPWSVEDFPGLDAKVCSGEPMHDLFCMSWCDLVVSTASTFGLCATLIGDTCVYALNRTFHDDLTPDSSTPRHSAGTPEEVEGYISRADPIAVRSASDVLRATRGQSLAH